MLLHGQDAWAAESEKGHVRFPCTRRIASIDGRPKARKSSSRFALCSRTDVDILVRNIDEEMATCRSRGGIYRYQIQAKLMQRAGAH